MEWRAPAWVLFKKHRPPPRRSWWEIVQATKHGNARYHPDLVNRIEQLEMLCVRQGQLYGRRSVIRDFWLRFEFVVGASKGKETNYVTAEWHQSGPVHGRPITAEELRKKGARL